MVEIKSKGAGEVLLALPSNLTRLQRRNPDSGPLSYQQLHSRNARQEDDVDTLLPDMQTQSHQPHLSLTRANLTITNTARSELSHLRGKSTSQQRWRTCVWSLTCRTKHLKLFVRQLRATDGEASEHYRACYANSIDPGNSEKHDQGI